MIMKKLEKLLNEIYQANQVDSAIARREVLTTNMRELEQQGKNCFSCQGHCCTFVHNSMQITPLETLELCLSLQQQNRLDKSLIEHLRENIKKFRLDKEIPIGKHSFRRTYTCPFFNAGPKGCSIDLNLKPYGCLSFSTLEENVSESGHCAVYGDKLQQREVAHKESEDLANKYLIEFFQLYWEKLPIPIAIIELTKKLGL